MLDQKLPIFVKGNFEKINNSFMTEGVEVLREVKEMSMRWGFE